MGENPSPTVQLSVDSPPVHFNHFCLSVCRAATKKDEEKQRSYKQKKKRRRIKVQESSSSNEKVFEMFEHSKKFSFPVGAESI